MLAAKAGLEGRLPRVIACGGRSTAIRDFDIAVNRGGAAVLLVDSESPVAEGAKAASHLIDRGEWTGAPGDPRIHLMVQVMESWFLAQPEVLESHFGKGFDKNALPRLASVELLAKDKVYTALDKASNGCKRGPYSKSKQQGFQILEGLDVNSIKSASAFGRLFFEYLDKHCGESA